MSNQNAQYVVQHLDHRYIRSQVLDDYINSKPQEFGTRWTRTVGNDPIVRGEETFASMLIGANLVHS